MPPKEETETDEAEPAPPEAARPERKTKTQLKAQKAAEKKAREAAKEEARRVKEEARRLKEEARIQKEEEKKAREAAREEAKRLKEEARKQKEAEKLEREAKREEERRRKEEERARKEEEKARKQQEKEAKERAAEAKALKKQQRMAAMWSATGVTVSQTTQPTPSQPAASQPRRPAPKQAPKEYKKTFGLTRYRDVREQEESARQGSVTEWPDERIMTDADDLLAGLAADPLPRAVADFQTMMAGLPDWMALKPTDLPHPALKPRRRAMYFSEDYRPPYTGTFSRLPRHCTPVDPFGHESGVDYDTDSGAEVEWVDGDDVGSADDDDLDLDEEADREEREKVFVPDGYLSANEGESTDEDEDMLVRPDAELTVEELEARNQQRRAMRERLVREEGCNRRQGFGVLASSFDMTGVSGAYGPVLPRGIVAGSTVDGLKTLFRPRVISKKRKAPASQDVAQPAAGEVQPAAQAASVEPASPAAPEETPVSPTAGDA